MLTRNPFLLALLISSLIANAVQFVFPYKGHYEEPLSSEEQAQSTDRAQTKTNTAKPTPSIQIECDPACAAKRADERRNSSWWNYLEKIREDPIAGFTGLLFIATLILAGMTRKQVKDSRAIQRAHVFVVAHHEWIIHDNQIVALRAWARLKNSGTTPASPVNIFVVAEYVANPNQFEFGRATEQGIRQPHVLGPGAEAASTIDIGAGHILGNLNGEGQQFFWGWVRYRDIFPRSSTHVFEFCYRVVIEGHLVVGGGFEGTVTFLPHGEHNRYYDE